MKRLLLFVVVGLAYSAQLARAEGRIVSQLDIIQASHKCELKQVKLDQLIEKLRNKNKKNGLSRAAI